MHPLTHTHTSSGKVWSPWQRACALMPLLLCLCLPSWAGDASQPQIDPGTRHALLALLGGNHPQPGRLAAAEQGTVMLLIRQNLHALDPDNRLSASGTKAVTAQLANDIRPVVHQAFASISPTQWASTLEQAMRETLSPAQADSLRQALQRPAGQQYLAFSKALDQIVGQGLSQLASTPLSIRRDQMPAAEILRQRQQLLAMSTNVRQLRQAHPNGSPAALGVINDLLAVQSGAALDQLARQYQSSLPAFAAFQQSADGQALTQLQWRWANLQSNGVEAVLHHAASDLAARQPAWQALSRQWLDGKGQ